MLRKHRKISRDTLFGSRQAWQAAANLPNGSFGRANEGTAPQRVRATAPQQTESTQPPHSKQRTQKNGFHPVLRNRPRRPRTTDSLIALIDRSDPIPFSGLRWIAASSWTPRKPPSPSGAPPTTRTARRSTR